VISSGTGVENGKPAQGQRRPFSGRAVQSDDEAVESFASELLHAARKPFRREGSPPSRSVRREHNTPAAIGRGGS